MTSHVTVTPSVDCVPLRALTYLNLSDNALMAGGGHALATGLQDNPGLAELELAGNDLGHNAEGDADLTGVVAICNAISTMTALTALSLGNNAIVNIGGVDGIHGLHDVSGVRALATAIPKCR